MGDRLGGAIFLLFLLAIDGQFTQLQELRNVSCQSDCVTQDDDKSSCISSPNPGCGALDPSVDDEVTLAKSPLVRVTHIAVTPQLDAQYVVTLQWTSLSSDVRNSTTRGLHVQWQALSSSDTCSTSGGSSDVTPEMTTANSTHCQILHFVHSLSNPATIPPTVHWCYTTDDPSRCHRITLSSLHGNVSLSITVRMPPNLTIIQDPPAVSEWQTPVGVVVGAGQRSVLALLQGAPEQLNITSYRLTLVLKADGITIQEHQLSQNDTFYTFENITVDGIYIVRVAPLGPGCIPRCQVSESANIEIPGVLFGPSLTPPTISTTRAATTSAPAPRPTTTTTTPNDMTLHKTTTATDPSVIVKPAVDQTEYTKSRNIILGTVFGVLFLAIIATVIFCIYRRTRSVHTVGFPMQPFRRRRESNSSIIMDDALKNQPIVLLLYSYDCPAHEVVVTTFAYYLKEVGNCEVILDIWDQHNLQEQGVYAWLVDKVDIAEFIVMICSTGARFKCARNRQFRMKHDRTLPDVFAWGVDHVAEKIRTAANVTEAKTRYISAYFDYAGKSDIPPKLDITKRFCLMKDMYSFYCHLHSVKPGQTNMGSNSKHGLTVDSYSKTDEGRQLQDALIDAKHFFKEHPNWLGQTLEPITPILSASRDLSTDNASEDPTRLKRGGPASPSVRSENDPFLEERKKKRLREVEGTMERIPHSKKEELAFSTPCSSPSHAPSEGSNSVTSMSPLMSPVIPAKTRSGLACTASSGTLQSRELDLDEETDADDTSQMQRDIDFIQNFDKHHTWEKKNGVGGTAGHFFVDVDMGVYTPPEDFISLASLEEEANRALAQSSNPASPRHATPSPAASSTTPSVNSVGVPQGSVAVKPASETGSCSSPRKPGTVKNSPRKPSPAQSVSSIGSASRVNNHHPYAGNNGELAFHGQSPVMTYSSSGSSPPLLQSGSQLPCPTSTVSSPLHMNNDANARTSIPTPVCNPAAAGSDASPHQQHSIPHINPSSLSSSPSASSPSPPQSSSHHSSSHSSPYKHPAPTAKHSSRLHHEHAKASGSPRHMAGSTNGHFVVDFEPSTAGSSENCEDSPLPGVV